VSYRLIVRPEVDADLLEAEAWYEQQEESTCTCQAKMGLRWWHDGVILSQPKLSFDDARPVFTGLYDLVRLGGTGFTGLKSVVRKGRPGFTRD